LQTPEFKFSEERFSQFLRNGNPHAEAMAAGFHRSLFEAPYDPELFATALDSHSLRPIFAWDGPLQHWFEPAPTAEKIRLRHPDPRELR
jgi:hypothetical protein